MLEGHCCISASSRWHADPHYFMVLCLIAGRLTAGSKLPLARLRVPGSKATYYRALQVIGPRHSFLVKKDLLERAAVLASGVLDFSKLLEPTDAEFCEAIGASINEYEGHRNMFEEEYTNRLSEESAMEFQQELKKLGIYEGA